MGKDTKKKLKFNQVWSNQTDLGKRFGLSAVAVGKILIKEGLKDPDTKQATQKALDEGVAKATPLKDGTPYFMWSIEKVRAIISKDYEPLNKVNYWVNEVAAILRDAQTMCDEGNDKVGYMLADTAYDDVPKDVLEAVRSKIKELGLGE